MDAVTYSNALVKAELENWNFVKVDGDKHPDVVGYFGVSGYPSSVFVSADGKTKEVIPGAIAPGPFIELLKSKRAKL